MSESSERTDEIDGLLARLDLVTAPRRSSDGRPDNRFLPMLARKCFEPLSASKVSPCSCSRCLSFGTREMLPGSAKTTT